MAYEDFEDLTRRTASDKILRGKAFNIVKNLKYGAYQGGLVSTLYKCFDKKPLPVVLTMKLFIIKN